MDYDGRIVCTVGVSNTAGGGAISYITTLHTFTGSVKIGTLTVATTDFIPSLTGYAMLAAPQLTGAATLNSLSIPTKDVTTTPSYYSVGRFIELVFFSERHYFGISFQRHKHNCC